MSRQREADYWQDEPVEEVENHQIDEEEMTEQSSEDISYDDTVEYDPSDEADEDYSTFDDDQVSLFDDEDDEQTEQELEEALEESRKAMKPSRFKFINTIKEQIAEEIVETTEQFVADDDTIYQEKVARDELFLKRMLILAGVVTGVVIILAVISLLLS